jgi:F0F1-type ATP synthase membrane subunit a
MAMIHRVLGHHDLGVQVCCQVLQRQQPHRLLRRHPEFIAELARIISFTFRLQHAAGEILLLVMTFLMPFLVALPFYGLETFVGIIQAFVFAMLTLVFAVLAVSSHDDHGEHEEEHGRWRTQCPRAH